ncbi:GPI ethanolamine phosphate transferase 1 [Pleurotus pulmonarius]
MALLLVSAALQGITLAYAYRNVWVYTLVAVGVVWPVIAWPRKLLKERFELYLSWAISCSTIAFFHTLPVDAKEDLPTIMWGGVLMMSFGLVYWFWSTHGANQSRALIPLLTAMALAMWVTYGSVQSLQAKTGLPILNQFLGWVLLLASPLLALIVRAKFVDALGKTTGYFIGFGVWLVLLSVHTEGPFYVAYTMTLQVWIEVEATLLNEQCVTDSGGYRSLRLDDLRIAVFFLFFVQFAFFGAGNVASIVSFYLEPVYRLVITFKPFLVFGLLMVKAVIPYVILSASVATLNARLRLPPFSILLIALSLVDVVTLTFFYQVSDAGSWTEIDQPVGRFCVMSLLLLWSTGICAAGEYLMADSFDGDHRKVD